MQQQTLGGLTLVEVLLGALVLTIVLAAILGAYMGQLTLNEHARNMSLAINDASRVIEQIRRENTGCSQPEAVPAVPAGAPVRWDSWMNTGGGGAPKNVALNSRTGITDDAQELVVVTCLRNGAATPPAATDYCGDVDQIGSGEWKRQGGANTDFDVLQLTVAVCWRHRNRVIGECRWTGTVLQDNDNGDGVISSPVMLTTLVTCDGA